jgi:monoterpene epsilon-lactone hydrolase
MKTANMPEPPSDVARRHTVTASSESGVRVVWLDQHHRRDGTILYVHGGSYITGPRKEQWEWFAALCRSTEMAGVLVDYSLAPESAYPVALEQVLRVTQTLGTRWYLAGDSAGGGLAIGALYRLRDMACAMPTAIVLSSPWLDVTMADSHARANHRIDPMLSLRGLARAAAAYAAGSDPREPCISPLYGDPAGLPAMQLHVGTRELFLWDCRAWQDRCERAGCACELVEVEGGFHDFAMAVSVLPEARVAVSRQARFILGRT